MKKAIKALMMILAIPSAACSASNVDAEKATEMINNGAIILDVRTPDEFREGHIKNAINIDFYGDDFQSKINLLDKSKTYVIYCRSGRRSASADKIFQKAGFKNTSNLLKGIIGWKNEGRPIQQE